MSTEIKAGDWVKVTDSTDLGSIFTQHSLGKSYKVEAVSTDGDLINIIAEGRRGAFFPWRFTPVSAPEGIEHGDEVMLRHGVEVAGISKNKVYSVNSLSQMEKERICVIKDDGKLDWVPKSAFELVATFREAPIFLSGDIVVHNPNFTGDVEISDDIPYRVERVGPVGKAISIRNDEGNVRGYLASHFSKMDASQHFPFSDPPPPLDFTKPITTRDGRKVEVVTTKVRGNGGNVMYYIEDSENMYFTNPNGRMYDDPTPRKSDLINVQWEVEPEVFKTYISPKGDILYFSTEGKLYLPATIKTDTLLPKSAASIVRVSLGKVKVGRNDS